MSLKKMPVFKNEDEERDFWTTHEVTEYFDVDKAIVNPSMPNLKPSTESISIRLPISLLESIKVLANKKDVPYQSLIKIILSDKLNEENKSIRK